jgi:uncharacterized protein (TIGR02598 family)
MTFKSTGTPRQGRRGFSLVELALALAILAVAVVGLLALLPSGMTQARTAMDTTVTAQIAQRIMSDAQQSEFDALIDRAALPPDPLKQSYCPERFSFRAPKVAEPALRYFDEQGKEVLPVKPGALNDEEKRAVVYYASTRIRPRAELQMASESNSHIAQVTVQVLRNTNHTLLEFETDAESPSWNLVKEKNGYMFAGLIGRRQGQ